MVMLPTPTYQPHKLCFISCILKELLTFFPSRFSDNADMNSEDTSSSSSEEEKEADAAPPVNGLSLKPSWSSVPHSVQPLTDRKEEDYERGEEEDVGSCLPTIFFSHTVEPKKVGLFKKKKKLTDDIWNMLFLLILFNPFLSL